MFDGLAGLPGVAVAISGGSDSTALLHLLLDWQRGTGKSGPQITALTVDHGLRPESADEARAVALACGRLGVHHVSLVWTGEKPATGIQAKARQARYDLMTGWCRAHDVPVLLTGHTADDQAETVLMRARRTNSFESLAAIWPENSWNGVRLLRPLLDLRRSELRRYLQAQAMSWLDDPSNSSPRFERVRLRQNMAASDVPALAAQARAAQQKSRAVAGESRRWFAAHVVHAMPGALAFPPLAFTGLESSLAIAVLRHFFTQFGRVPGPERAEIADLARWCREAAALRRTLGGLLFARQRGHILVGREPGRIAARFVPLEAGQSLAWDGRYRVEGPAGIGVGPCALAPELGRPKSVPQWVWRGLPALRLANGKVIAAFAERGEGRQPIAPAGDMEQLGIQVTATYVNGLKHIPVV
jgi:tRNA(Ile)-lysidine synthase